MTYFKTQRPLKLGDLKIMKMKPLIYLIIAMGLTHCPATQKRSSLNQDIRSQQIHSCQKDSDCQLVQEGCCPCSMGGKKIALLLNQVADYKKKREETCSETTMCMAMISQDPSCLDHAQSVCQNSVCQISSSK